MDFEHPALRLRREGTPVTLLGCLYRRKISRIGYRNHQMIVSEGNQVTVDQTGIATLWQRFAAQVRIE